MSNALKSGPRLTFIALFVAFAFVPLIGIVSVAFTTSTPGGVHFSVDNLTDAWQQGGFGTSLRSSLIVALTVLPAAAILSMLGGFAFAMYRFPGHNVLYVFVLFGMMVPLEATIIPLYYGLRQVELTDTYWSLILPQIALHIPFGIFWMRTTFQHIPSELIDAARIDGLRDRQVLWRILVPLSRAPIGAMLALQFMWVWNEFLLPLVMVRSDSLRTATLSISVFRGQYSDSLPLLAAACLIVAGPVVIAFLLFQRGFINGVVAGAVKE